MAFYLLDFAVRQWTNSQGVPLAGGSLELYLANTSTAAASYTDSTGAVQNQNPMQLDVGGWPSDGSAKVQMWVSGGQSYKIIIKDSNGVTVYTEDNIPAQNDVSTAASEYPFTLPSSGLTYISPTSFSVAGDYSSILTRNRRWRAQVAAGTVYGYVLSSVYSAPNTTVTVAPDSTSLDNGLSTFSYSILSGDHPGVPNQYYSAYYHNIPAQGRLTLTSGTAVTTADVTGAATVYFTPYRGQTVSTYDGMVWSPATLSEVSQALSDNTKSPAAATANKNYDMFLWNDAGTLRCTRGPTWDAGAVAGSDTARGTGAGSTELELFQGRWVNKNAITNGPAARCGLYVGSIRTDGSAQVNDSAAKRHVWNNYNRVRRSMQVIDTTDTWNYTTAAYRQANANTANQLDILIGLAEDEVRANVVGIASNSTANVGISVAVGVDSTTVASGIRAPVTTNSAAAAFGCHGSYVGYPGLGRHFLAWLEFSGAAGTTQWQGDVGGTQIQSGIQGDVFA